MKLSVIITVYNRKEHLRKALLSLGNQTRKPDELILADDGSDENIPEAVGDIISEFDFPVIYVKHEHKGFRLAKTRNNGVRAASGDLLIFLDQDLIHTRRMLEVFERFSAPKRFITGMPIWLSKEKSEQITEKEIRNYDFLNYLSDDDKATVIKQYKKDRTYYLLHKLRLTNQPRLRGGVCAINMNDFTKINGYDEKFIGWGAEDDDLGRRLYKTGVSGFNPFSNDFAIHIWHPKAVIADKGVKEQANYEYYSKKKKEIKAGKFKAEFGLENPYGESDFEVTILK